MSDQNKDIEEAFTYLPTCLDAFSKNFVLEATLQAKKRTDMLVTVVLLEAPFRMLHLCGSL